MSATAVAAPELTGYAMLGQGTLALVAVLAVIGVAFFAARRLGLARSAGSGRLLRIVETLAVGQRERVLLIEADGKRFLIGVAPGQVRELNVTRPGSFGEALHAARTEASTREHAS